MSGLELSKSTKRVRIHYWYPKKLSILITIVSNINYISFIHILNVNTKFKFELETYWLEEGLVVYFYSC